MGEAHYSCDSPDVVEQKFTAALKEQRMMHLHGYHESVRATISPYAVQGIAGS